MSELTISASPQRGLKDMELDTSSIEKRFAFGFLQQLLRWMDISQEFIAHLGRKKSPPIFPCHQQRPTQGTCSPISPSTSIFGVSVMADSAEDDGMD